MSAQSGRSLVGQDDDTVSDQNTPVVGRSPIGGDAPRGEVVGTTGTTPGGGVVSDAAGETHMASTVAGPAWKTMRSRWKRGAC